jgi:hypothetical protein
MKYSNNLNLWLHDGFNEHFCNIDTHGRRLHTIAADAPKPSKYERKVDNKQGLKAGNFKLNIFPSPFLQGQRGC